MSMKIAVALGGEYADFLIGLLMEKKYKVTVIDPDKAFCEHLCASYNVNAVLGDPCRQFILEEAGIRNYDVILALGREDTDNFEICQMGRKVLGIKRSVCLVHNPRNAALFEELGVDRAVNLPMILAQAIWVISTILAIVLDSCGIRAENLLLVYLLGVLISILATSSLAWALCAAIVFTFTFNYLFTEPKLTFHMDDVNYVVSSIVFVAAASIVATLVVKLQKQMQIANKKREITARMNEIGSGFLNLSGYQQIKEYSEESLSNLTGKPVSVLLKEDEKKEFPNYMAEWCYRQSIPCGHGECQFPDDNGLYVPIRNREKTYGVIIFDCEGWTLSEEEKIYVDTVISQLTLVIERELLSREKENTRIQVERERLKSTLLRSISHDLRTPLTGITGSAGFLLDNLGIMDEATIKSMLKDICSDSEWLSTMVENLLNLTRIQEGRLDINKKKEVVDDLVASAVRLVSNRVGNHTLKMETPEDILLVSVDGRLFIQVLVNLLDNAFRHSGTGTTVTLRVKQDGNCLKFVVSDNGIGIPNDKIDKIFDNFFTTAYENGDKQRGVGLGLTICKAMVEAQGGTIRAFNSPQGGAVFEVSMPMEDRKDE